MRTPFKISGAMGVLGSGKTRLVWRACSRPIVRYMSVSAFFFGAVCEGGLSVWVLSVRLRRSLGDQSVWTSSAVSGS